MCGNWPQVHAHTSIHWQLRHEPGNQSLELIFSIQNCLLQYIGVSGPEMLIYSYVTPRFSFFHWR